MATDQDFKKSLGFLLQSEGGFNNIPGDPGGATNCGISLRFLQGSGDYDLGDLDHDGDIDIDDIRAMDPESSGRIYKKYFWNYFPMAGIPAQVAYVLFDVAVNSGQKTAAKLLQATLPTVKADGSIGPQTLQRLALMSAYAVAERMLTLRGSQYREYCAKNPALNKFLTGWLNRVGKVRQNLLEFSA